MVHTIKYPSLSPIEDERFRALVEHSLDAVALVEPNGTVSYVSASIVRLLGYPADEFVNLAPFEVVHPDDREQAMELLSHIASHPGGSQTVVNRVRHKDGSWRWIETVSTNQLENPSVRAVVANFRDITDRKLRRNGPARARGALSPHRRECRGVCHFHA